MKYLYGDLLNSNQEFKRKSLPMFAKEFIPNKGMMPVEIIIGSFDAIFMIKNNRQLGIFNQICIKLDSNPKDFKWFFLKGLPVIIWVPNEISDSFLELIIKELAFAGVEDIAAISKSGEIKAVYTWSVETRK